ncbi:MAG: DAK2 domain-containing protein [Clostridia bacterium]|nr:DAK2 domain-containing protein [Clostridia bacterium]
MTINGKKFAEMLISAANALDNNKTAINNMNVFPVPDGDTGINMTLTLTAVRALRGFDGTLAECAEKMAPMVLRAARGNSGAILSLFFRGVAKSLAGLESADSPDFAKAFKKGTEEAYKAVMKPTEGTILTVMRLTSDKAVEVAEDYKGDVLGLFEVMYKESEDALAKTPDMLPVLKEVNVVDAGGYGFCTALLGMLSSLRGEPVEAENEDAGESDGPREATFESFSTEDIKFAYCTECIVDKDDAHKGEGSAAEVNEYICSLGDSVVFVDDETMIKLHVHTNNPGLVIEKVLEYGAIATLKVENMKLQHSEKVVSAAEAPKMPKTAAPEKKYGFVSVCMGSGIKDTFKNLGVDKIIYGGQTMNPSTQDIIDAVNLTPAETVFVLPNNKNIYLVACQAAELIKDKKVEVIPTNSVPEGISAMIVFDESMSAEENAEAMKEAKAAVTSISITYSVRGTKIDGVKIREGQILGLVNGKIASVANSDEEVIENLVERMKDASFVTVFYGEKISEEAAEGVLSIIKSKISADTEVTLIKGGQPIYDYIISVE